MRSRSPTLVATLALVALATVACTDPMMDQPRIDPLEGSRFFADGAGSRPLVEGTVPRGHLREDEYLETGRLNGELADAFPFPVDLGVMRRGRERYGIFCTACHGALGDGRGMVVLRGFRAPTSFHDEKLRGKPISHWVDVMTTGFGAMSSYARQIPPRDRWAIAAYVRALQKSRDGRIENVPADARAELEGSK